MTDQISFKCASCGSADFIFPNKPPKDDDIISCNGCKREVGKYDVVRKAMMKAGKAEITKLTKEAFRKLPSKWRR